MKYELCIYWGNKVAIECIYFPTLKDAERYANINGVFDNYVITRV